jgi:acyl-CoA reductase-like NAD-dependent aldehyde dehydrogenase
MAILKIAPVLATGCTAILKPSELTPLSALKLGQILVQSGMPDGAINILNGYGHDLGMEISLHHDIDKIGFTGSLEIAKEII